MAPRPNIISRIALICTSNAPIAGVLRGFIKHKSINAIRSVAIIIIMATSLSASGIIMGHNATKKFLAKAGTPNQ